MPKKTVRRKRRAAKKQSFFDKYLTFPKLALILFIALLLVWIYQVTIPGGKTANGAESTVSAVK